MKPSERCHEHEHCQGNAPVGLGCEQPFGPAIHVPELSSVSSDSRPYLSKDGSVMVFGSARPGGEGPDTWYASRDRIKGHQ